MEMGTISMMKEPYEAALEGKWEEMTKWFDRENRGSKLATSMTVTMDTAFHVAVYSGSEEPLKALLDIARKENVENKPLIIKHAFRGKNAHGNTALHEAAANGNFKAVKLLVEDYSKDLGLSRERLRREEDEEEDLVQLLSDKGETPLLRAAAYGHKEIVGFLASQPGQITPDKKLAASHRYRINRKKGITRASILHEAIEAEHFETALLLMELDPSLAELEDRHNRTSLELLANMPSAFRSGYQMSIMKDLFYNCLPDDDTDQKHDIDCVKDRSYSPEDLESCQSKNNDRRKNISSSIWRFFSRACPCFNNMMQEKRKHVCALELAKILIKKDTTWENSVIDNLNSDIRTALGRDKEEEENQNKKTQIPQQKRETPLFAATRHGIIEIVEEILRVHPQAVGHTNEIRQTILHLAVKYRQKQIFDRVKNMEIPMTRMVRAIDDNSYTILHHAALMDGYNAGVSRNYFPAGTAFHLQAELKWFKRVEKLLPTHFAMHHDRKNRTAKALFDEEHKKLHVEAQKWLKETSQSCSAVCALLAGVVFAAAYDLPGGTDERGRPNLEGSTLFNFFTIMDVVSLAGSLTSLVMFLSILSSTFELENFLRLLPWKLIFAFALLFLSVATTMLAFTATVLLIISLEAKHLTLTLVYTAAFLPVCILALTQLPLYGAFTETVKSLFKTIRKSRLFKSGSRLFLKKN